MAARTIFRSASFKSCARPPAPSICLRTLATSSAFSAKALPPRPKPPPDSEIEEYYIKGSGPGGQKINKTNSAVQLKHIPTGIVVKSQATRSRDQNRKHARELLAQRIDDLENGDQSRSAIVGGVKQRKAASATKKSRRKYKKLEEEKLAAEPKMSPHEIAEHTTQAQNDATASTKKGAEITIQRI